MSQPSQIQVLSPRFSQSNQTTSTHTPRQSSHGQVAHIPEKDASATTKTTLCINCNRQIPTERLVIHQKTCRPKATRSSSNARASHASEENQTSRSDLNRTQNETPASEARSTSSPYVPCQKCGRSFFPYRLADHMKVCKGTPTQTKLKHSKSESELKVSMRKAQSDADKQGKIEPPKPPKTQGILAKSTSGSALKDSQKIASPIKGDEAKSFSEFEKQLLIDSTRGDASQPQKKITPLEFENKIKTSTTNLQAKLDSIQASLMSLTPRKGSLVLADENGATSESIPNRIHTQLNLSNVPSGIQSPRQFSSRSFSTRPSTAQSIDSTSSLEKASLPDNRFQGPPNALSPISISTTLRHGAWGEKPASSSLDFSAENKPSELYFTGSSARIPPRSRSASAAPHHLGMSDPLSSAEDLDSSLQDIINDFPDSSDAKSSISESSDVKTVRKQASSRLAPNTSEIEGDMLRSSLQKEMFGKFEDLKDPFVKKQSLDELSQGASTEPGNLSFGHYASSNDEQNVSTDSREGAALNSPRGVIVYDEVMDDMHILGEIIILPGVTISDVRRMIVDELGQKDGFTLRKGKIPIHHTQNHKEAGWFFRERTDHIILSHK